MQIDIAYKPQQALARVALQPGESVVAEAGAMVGLSTNVNMDAQMQGGLLGGIKRLFAGETLFRNTFTAQGAPGEVFLAQSLAGDMTTLDMTPAGYYLASSSFVASTPDVQVETKLGGLRGFLSGGGLFIMRAHSQSPQGKLVVGGFGGIEEVPCHGNVVIDTGHLVAWDATLQYSIGRVNGGWVSTFFTGEGLVCHFQGEGRIWIQTRNAPTFGKLIGRQLPARQS